MWPLISARLRALACGSVRRGGFGDFRADALDRCVHDPFAYRESYSLLLRLSYSELPAVGSIASGFIPPNPFAVSPNEEERSALDAHARPGLEKRDMVQSMSSGRPAALGSIMSTLEQRRDQMFPKLRPEEIDRTATAAIGDFFSC